MKKTLFVTDCEGPITRNDNAYEITRHYLPQGDRIYSLISRYDDILADEIKRADYRAGNTLRLIVPFLIAFGATDEKLMKFAKTHLLTMPKAKEALHLIKTYMPSYIISTSFEPYILALCDLLEFPKDHTYFTRLALDCYDLTKEEKKILKKIIKDLVYLCKKIDKIESISYKNPEGKRIIKRLDEIFFAEIPNMEIGLIYKEVNPVGNKDKLEALLEILKQEDCSITNVIYVGDSITDGLALEAVKNGDGVAISFNGNSYAIKNSEIAIISKNSFVIAFLAYLFWEGGKNRLMNIVDQWDIPYIRQIKVPDNLNPVKESLLSHDFPEVKRIRASDMEFLISKSEATRREIRGETIGALG